MQMPIEYRTRLIGLLLAWACIGLSCTGRFLTPSPTVVLQNDQFILVTAAEGDSPASLAETYLHDADKAWWIACANDSDHPAAGQLVVIPLSPAICSSLKVNGYQKIPVLRYADVSADDPESKTIHATVFEQQMAYLKTNGFRTINLDDLLAFLNFEAPVPPDSVVITLDSSDRWVYDIAFPVLKKFGLRAAVFIATDRIGKPGHLSWPELTEMVRAGFDLGTCGRTGRYLTSRQPKEDDQTYIQAMAREIIDSRKLAEMKLGRPVRYFAYPYCRVNDVIIAFLKKHEYRLAFTCKPGGNPVFGNEYRIRRSTIFPGDDLLKFQGKLTTFRSAEFK